LTTTPWKQKSAKLMSPDVGLQTTADPDDHHAAAVLPIDGASEFPVQIGF